MHKLNALAKRNAPALAISLKKHCEVHILLNTRPCVNIPLFTAHFSWQPAPIDLALMLRLFKLNDTAAINPVYVHLQFSLIHAQHVLTIKALLMGFPIFNRLNQEELFSL